MGIADIKNYKLLKEENLKGIKAKGYLLRHEKKRRKGCLYRK